MNLSRETRIEGRPARTLMIRTGIAMFVASGIYMTLGLLNFVHLELTEWSWNNIRIVAGCGIVGCLMAAVGYGDQ